MNEEEQHSQQAPALFDQYRTNRPETPSISGEVETFEDAPVERPVVGGLKSACHWKPGALWCCYFAKGW